MKPFYKFEETISEYDMLKLHDESFGSRVEITNEPEAIAGANYDMFMAMLKKYHEWQSSL